MPTYPSSISRLAELLIRKMNDQIYQKVQTWITGRRISVTSVTLRDSVLQPNQIYVRPSDESFDFKVVWGSVPRVNVPVKIRLLESGEWEVDSADYPQGTQVFGAALESAVMPSLVGELLRLVIPGYALRPGRIRADEAGGLNVYVEPFTFWYEGEEKRFEGGVIDIASSLPGTTDTWRWVKIGVNPATLAVSSFNGSTQSIYTLLDENDIAGIQSNAVIPCGAVKLRYGQTQVPAVEGDFVDARHHYWTPHPALTKTNYNATTAPGVGDDTADGYSIGSVWLNLTGDEAYICLDASTGAAVWKRLDNLTTSTLYYQTVQANGTSAPQQPILNLVAGNGIILSGTNDIANTRTTVTITRATTYSTVTVDSTVMPQRATLRLLSGTNVTLSGVDDSVLGRTDVTINASGAGMDIPNPITSAYVVPANQQRMWVRSVSISSGGSIAVNGQMFVLGT